MKLLDPQAEYEIHLDDDDGSLDHVYFVLKGAQDIWARSKGSVLLYDTKHGTNRYGFKLGCFTCVDKNGKTRVLAGLFLLSEDEDSFKWAYEEFEKSLGSAPIVFFTDSDLAMAAAVKSTWPDTIHLFCTFHIWKNFYKHIHPLFNNNAEAWRNVAKMFWRLSKCDTFDTDFNGLIKFISDSSKAGEETVSKKYKWLNDLKTSREQWAACYTWQHCTFRIHSTQRVEAINSAIATFCSKTSTILDIVHDLEQMAEEQHLKSERETLDVMFGNAIGASPSTFPTIDNITTKLTGFARHLTNVQAAQIFKYQCIPIDGSEVPDAQRCFSVSIHSGSTGRAMDDEEFNRAADHGISTLDNPTVHVTTLSSCSCQFSECWRLPCRHIFCCLFENPELWEIVMVRTAQLLLQLYFSVHK